MDTISPSYFSGAFSSFRNRAFFWFWLASLVSNVGSWMQRVGQAWSMTGMTQTPVYTALLQTLEAAPVVLLALPAGLLADRLEKKYILLFTQFVLVGVAMAMWLFSKNQALTPQILLILVALGGVCYGIQMPAWNSAVFELVGKGSIDSAITANSLSYNVARVLGPVLAGWMIAWGGETPVFLVNVVSFLGVLFVIASWKPRRTSPPTTTLWVDLKNYPKAFRVMMSEVGFRNTQIWTLQVLFIGSTFWALVPEYARDVLQLAPGQFGVVFSAFGVGAISIGLWLPKLREKRGNSYTAGIGVVILAVGFLVAGLSQVPWAGYLSVLLIGAGWISANSTIMIGAQIHAPSHLRGRGLAIHSLSFQIGLALGSLLSGYVAAWIGVSQTFIATGVVFLVSFAFLWRRKF